MIEDSDIVVTTYHTLTTEYLMGKGKTSPLYKLGWYRVVLDEGKLVSSTVDSRSNAIQRTSSVALQQSSSKLAIISTPTLAGAYPAHPSKTNSPT